MNLERLEYIKSVSHLEGKWAYPEYREGAYFKLNFKQGTGVEAHAAKLPKGALVLLSQNYQGKRYLSHVVEIVNEACEDQPQWEISDWGIVRWIKVIWAAESDTAPLDAETLEVDWGWHNTKAKALDGPNLMKRWHTLDALRAHVSTVLDDSKRLQVALVNG